MNIESKLMAQQSKLYEAIQEKNTNDLHLPVNVGGSMIGFGKILDFYMFWISERRGVICFHARKRFTRIRTDNSVRLAFVEENRDAIMNAIDDIYNSYIQALACDQFQQEKQRIEEKKTICATIAKNKAQTPEVMLLWNDVTVLTYEKAAQSSNILDIDADRRAEFEIQGQRIVESFDDLFRIMESRCHQSMLRAFAVYRQYIEHDSCTLADIALQYGVSRERIRQLINRVGNKLFGSFKKMMLFDHAGFNACVERLASAFDAVDHDAILLTIFGFSAISNKKKQAILTMLFGTEFSDGIMEKCAKLCRMIRDREEQNKEQCISKYKKTLEAWRKLQEKIQYPSDFQADQAIPIGIYQKDQSFLFERKICEKFKKFEELIEIIEDPDIIYYSSSQTDHRPHVLLRLPNGASVLVLIVPTINMAFSYNIIRCNELHRFCKENGYGYMIIDDCGRSIYELRSREIDPALEEQLNAILEDQGVIFWRNIKEIKETRSVSNADIAAYVLQNKLHFTREPFCIRRRKNVLC